MHGPLIRRLKQLVELNGADEQSVRSLPVEHAASARYRDLPLTVRAPDFLYYIISGWAGRYGLRTNGSRRITGFLLAGDFCGIHAVAGSAINHSVVALTDCELGKIPIDEVKAIASRRPSIEQALWRAKLVDEAMLRQWLLSSGDALQAVARMLCELHARATAAGLCHEGACEMPLTQEQLGDATGFTHIHTNRIVQKLRRSGLVSLQNGRLEILDYAALSTLAQWKPSDLHPWDPR